MTSAMTWRKCLNIGRGEEDQSSKMDCMYGEIDTFPPGRLMLLLAWRMVWARGTTREAAALL
eukprot:13552637-Ditylum_brightwellii.AAC.1